MTEGGGGRHPWTPEGWHVNTPSCAFFYCRLSLYQEFAVGLFSGVRGGLGSLQGSRLLQVPELDCLWGGGSLPPFPEPASCLPCVRSRPTSGRNPRWEAEGAGVRATSEKTQCLPWAPITELGGLTVDSGQSLGAGERSRDEEAWI